MTRSHALVPALLLALAACTPDFDPASRIEKLRVLAIRAEPPEIDPDGVRTASLTSLVLRAGLDAEPVRTTTVVHLACVPAGGETRPSACGMLGALADPAAVLDQLAGVACAGGGDDDDLEFVPPVLAGVEACVRGACGPATLAGGAALPPPTVSVGANPFATASGTEKILGTEAVVLAFALDATPDEVAAPGAGPCPGGDLAARLAALWRTREHVLSAKRVRIRGPASPDPANRNPAVGGIVAGAVTLADPAALATVSGGELALAPLASTVPGEVPETYSRLDANGLLIARGEEEWVYSWFSTAGALDELHTRGAETNRWSGLAAGTRAKVAVVVRDLRGGTAWAVREVVVAP